MRPKLFQKLAYLPLLAMIITPLASASPTLKNSGIVQSETWSFETEASGLLKEISSLSGKLKTDGSTLESYKGNRLSWQTHADKLSQVRAHINEIGERLERLQAIQSVAASWQQRAIDELVPVAAALAAQTQSAIEHLNENRGYLYAPSYGEHLTSIADRSGELKESVDTFLEFAKTSEKVDALQQKLDQLQDRIGLSES